MTMMSFLMDLQRPQNVLGERVAARKQTSSVDNIACFSFNMTTRRLGVACYDAFNNTLRFTEVYVFLADAGEVLFQLQRHLLPTTILVRSDIDNELLALIRNNHKVLQVSGDYNDPTPNAGQLADLDLRPQKLAVFNLQKALFTMKTVKIQQSDLKFADIVDVSSVDNTQLIIAT